MWLTAATRPLRILIASHASYDAMTLTIGPRIPAVSQVGVEPVPGSREPLDHRLPNLECLLRFIRFKARVSGIEKLACGPVLHDRAALARAHRRVRIRRIRQGGVLSTGIRGAECEAENGNGKEEAGEQWESAESSMLSLAGGGGK